MEANKKRDKGVFYIVRLTALIFLLTGLLFSSLLLNVEPIHSEVALRINLLISGIFPVLIGASLLLMIFCPDSWTKHLSSRALLLAILGGGFIFLYAIVSFTESILATPGVMSGIVGEVAKLAGAMLLTGSFALWVVERREREQILQESRNRYRGLIESQQDMIVMTDPNNRLTFVNDAYCETFGKSRRELMGSLFAFQIHEDDIAKTRGKMEELKRPPYRVSFEQRIMSEKGWRWIEWGKGAVLDEEDKITEIQGIGRDITEQKQARLELRKAKERFQAVISNSPLLICEFDICGRYLLVNPAVTEIFSVSPSDMIGKSFSEFLSPETVGKFMERINRIKETQEPIDAEDGIKVNDNERLFRTTLFPLFDASGKVNSVGAIGTDITEYRKMSVYLRRSEKLAALGELVAGVAHEIKNPLNTMMGFADLLLSQEEGVTDGVKKDIKKIYDASQRINTITDGLVSFSRKGNAKKCAIDINELLRETLKLKENHLNSGKINVEKKLDPGLPPVNGSKEQMEQIFLNLFNNAEYFMHEKDNGGTLTVCTSQGDNQVIIQVLDTGPGIPEDALDNLFTPFFTTKPEGEGTGLGLSVSYGIIKDHDGRLDAENRKEGGAVFTIFLPAMTKEEGRSLL